MNRIPMLATALLSAFCFASTLSAVEIGQDAPNFEFEKTWNMPGEPANLKALEGKVAMVEVWATW